MNHNVNYGLGVTVISQCRSIDCNKCITLAEDVDKEGGYVCGGGQGIWQNKSLYLPFNFAEKLQLLLKNKVFKKLLSISLKPSGYPEGL